MNGGWVLITGASSGIGLSLARIFASNRYRLVLVARHRDRLEQVAEELNQRHGVEVRALAKDLSTPGSCAEILSDLQASGIAIEILANNAGFGLKGPFAETEERVTGEMIQVNIQALVQLTRLFLPPMLARGTGKILNVSSTAAFQPGPHMAVYYATKAFVTSFSYALAEEVARSGVTVTALHPGPTRTDFNRRAGTTSSERVVAHWIMDPDEVARLGYRALMRGRRRVIPGLINQAGFLLSQILPTTIMAKMARRVIEGDS